MVTVLIVKMTAKSGCEAALKNELIKLTDASLQEDGCLEYQLIVNRSNPHTFVLYEKWQDDLYLENHRQTEHFKNFDDLSAGLLINKPSVKLYDLI